MLLLEELPPVPEVEDPLLELSFEDPVLLDDEPPVPVVLPDVLPVEPVPEVELPLPEV